MPTDVKDLSWNGFRKALASGDEAVPYVIHRLIGYPFFLAGVKLGVKANYMTVLSLLFSIAAAVLLLADGYLLQVYAVIFLNLGLAVDTIDGPLARHRKEASDFGAWLSALGLTIKTITIWSCLAIGVYWRETEPTALILGIIAVGHLFATYHLMRTNKTYDFYQFGHGAVAVTKTRRLGLEMGWVSLISLFALLDRLYLLLIVFAGIGAVPWSILILRAVQSYLHKDMDSDS